MAERLMTSTCTITRPGIGKGEFNDETGQYDDEPARITVYTGKCRIQIKSSGATGASSGERVTITQQSEWQGPITGTENVSVDDVIHIDTCPTDSALAGREFTVAGRNEKTHATSRRLPVSEVTG
jgi:hypothetical protein